MIKCKDIPNKMKALVLNDIGKLDKEIVDVPELKKDCVILKVKACGICSSDIERVFITGTYHFPTIPGHEFSGEIVGVYDENDKSLLGKNASVFPLLPCFKCEACMMKNYAQCSNYNYFGSRCDGAYSEYLVVPKWNLVFFDNTDHAIAALCEPAAVAMHAINKANIIKGNKIFIMGSGTIGLLIALILQEKGYDVYVGARKKKTIDFINKIGLTSLDTNNFETELKNITNNKGFDVVFEVIGSNESISKCIESANNYAKIILVGNPKDNLDIPKNTYWKILRKEITLSGTWNSSYNENINDWKEAMEFMNKKQEIFNKLITHKFTLDNYEKAFYILRDKQEFKVKVMFEMK